MFSFKSWVRQLKTLQAPAKSRRLQALRMERLEDRTTPSHFRGAALVPSINSSGILTVESTTFWIPTFVASASPVARHTDGTTVTLTQQSSSQDTSDTRFTKVTQVHKTATALPKTGTWNITWSGNARIGGVLNALESSWEMNSLIVYGGSATTPIGFNFSAVQPEVVRGRNYSGNLSVVAGPGLTLSYDQALNNNITSQAPGFQINTTTGALSIPATSTTNYGANTRNPSGDYAFSGNVFAKNATGEVVGQVEFDWLFDAVDVGSVNLAPTVTDAAVSANVGTAISHTFAGSDPDGDALTWSFVGLIGPGGALPASAPTFNTTTRVFSWNSTGSAAGTWIAQVRATDPFSLTDIGNLTINLSSAPDLIVASDTGSSNTDNVTRDNTPTFEGVVGAGNTVRIFAGTTQLGSTTANAQGQWSFTAGVLADGVYAVTSEATDGAGNKATSAALSVTIDTAAPVITGAADRPPNTNGWYTADVTVSFSASDALSGGVSPPPSVVLGEGANQSVSRTVTDLAGNSATATVAGINVDKTAPTLTVSGADRVNEGSLYTLTLGAVSDFGPLTVSKYTIHWGDGVTSVFDETNPLPVSRQVSHTYADGSTGYTITVDLTDDDGTHPAAGSKSVAVDNVAPTLTMSGSGSVNEGSTYTLTLTRTAEPGADTIQSWTINWGDGSAPEVVAGNATSVTHVYADGTRNHTILATATDEDGTYTVRAAGSNAQASLDPSFGTAGEVVQNLDGHTGDIVRSLSVVQPDGKVLVAGYTSGGTTRIALARYNPNGSADTTFGTAGMVVTEFDQYATAESVLVDAAGNVLVAGNFGIARYSPAGVLDSAFGNGGRLTGFTGVRKAVLDGAGNVVTTDGNRFARILPSGAFDLTFGTGGVSQYVGYYVYDFTLTLDGKIVALENRYNGNQADRYDVIVRRYLANGSADASFGTAGQYAYDNGGREDFGFQVVIQQGKVLVGGYTAELQPSPTNPNQYQTVRRDTLLFRLAADGQGLDPTFGTAGTVSFRYNAANSNYDYFYGMGVDASDRVLVNGSYGLYRFSPSGQPDTAFGGSPGYAQRAISMSGNSSPVVFGGGQSIYVAGSYYPGGTEGANFGVQRFLNTGMPDAGFDGDGLVQTGFSGPLADYLRSVTVRQADGKILAVGYTSGGTSEMILARYLPSGQLDATFGTPRPGDPAGVVRTGINGSVNAAAVAADGTIYLTNGSYLYRFLPSGVRDTSSTTNGFVNGERYAQGVYVRSLKIDGAGRLVVGGSYGRVTNGTYSSDLAVARFSPAGVPDASFGSGGLAWVDVGTTATVRGEQSAVAIDVDAAGGVVAVGSSQEYTQATNQWNNYQAVVARFTPTGQLDTTFNPSGGGLLLTTGADGSTSPQTVAVDSQNRVLVGYSTALHRFNPDGSPDATFNGTGVASTGGYYSIQALVLDGLGRVVTAGSGYIGRFKADGTPDAAFGPGGRVYTANRAAYAVTVDDANRVLAAGYSNTGGSTGTDYWLGRYITDGLAVTVQNVAPTVPTITDPGSPAEGGSVTLTAASTDPAGANDPLTYTWTVYRNSSTYLQASGATLTFSVPDSGNYQAVVTVNDGDGGARSSSRSFPVTNVAPTATFNAPTTGTEGTAFTVSLTNPADVSSVDAAAGFTYAFNFGTGYGPFSADNSATFTPANDGAYEVKAKVRDKDGAEREYTATVVVANVAPVASDRTLTTAEDQAGAGSAAATDAGNDPLTYSLVSQAQYGAVTVNADGTFTYTPNANYYGPDSFTYKASDGTLDSNVATVTVAVTPVNDAPAAQAGSLTTDEDAAAGGSVSASDVDGPAVTYTLATQAQHGTVALNADGTFTYTPNANYHGTDSFTFQASDGSLSDTAAVSLTVNSINDAPVLGAVGNKAADEGGVLTFTATATDVDAPSTLTYDLVGAPAGASIDPTTGAFTWTPSDNGTFTFKVRVTDSGSPNLSDEEEITVSVADVAPNLAVASPSVAVNEGTTATNSGTWGDVPADTVTLTASAGTVTRNADGTWNWSYAAADDLPATTVTVTATDDDGAVTSRTFTLTVANVDPSAAITGAPASSPEGAAIALGSTVSDPAGANDTLTYAWSVTKNGVAYGTVGTGTGFGFTPDDNGTYEVTLTVSDEDGGSTTVSESITVTNANPEVTITGAPTSGPEGTAIGLGSTLSDAGAADAHTLAWSVTKGGSPYASGTGAGFAFTPDDNGSYVVTLTATDDDGGIGSETQTVTVTNVAPTASILSIGSVRLEGTAIAVTGTATDPGVLDTQSYAWQVFKDGDAFASGSGADWSFAPDDNGSYTVRLTATDKDGDSHSVEQAIGVGNVAPTPTIASIGSVRQEGTGIAVSGSATDPAGANDTLSYAWSVTGPNGFTTSGTGMDWNFTPTDNGSYTVKLTVSDEDGGSAEVSETIGVVNLDPTAAITGAPASSPEGAAIALGSTVSDPAGANDTLTYAWSVTKNGVAYGTVGTGTGFGFTPDDNGTYEVTLTVSDEDGGSVTSTATLTVTNVAPTPSITSVGAVRVEGTAIAVTGTATDPAGANDTLNYAWAVYKDGSGTAYDTGSGASWSFTPNDNGTYRVVLTASDEDGGSASAEQTVSVANVNPTVGTLVGPIDPNSVNTSITFSSSFADTGSADTHTATWNWGDGTSETVTVTPGAISRNHTYAAAGVYTVTVTVRDDDGGELTQTFEYAVVYDASAGFVTGGGWVTSPAGALAADPTLTGRANFGFVSKYQSGSTVPTGDTEFQFKAGNFAFKSTSYEWLVISGAKARYRGTGTVNGTGSYGFELTAWDGQATGGGGVDRFRIKIWDQNQGSGVVYDNQMGAADGADPTTSLGGGSIVIHRQGQALRADGLPPVEVGGKALASDELLSLIDAAVRHWEATGVGPAELTKLKSAQVRIADLGESYLGMAYEGANDIAIDDDAAGWGWFVDLTPEDDREFRTPGDQGEQNRMDLLSVLVHEFGHLLGLDDEHGAEHADEVMGERLTAGVRRTPTDHDASEATFSTLRESVFVTADSLLPIRPAGVGQVQIPPVTDRPRATEAQAVRADDAVRPAARSNEALAVDWLPAFVDDTEELWGVAIDPVEVSK